MIYKLVFARKAFPGNATWAAMEVAQESRGLFMHVLDVSIQRALAIVGLLTVRVGANMALCAARRERCKARTWPDGVLLVCVGPRDWQGVIPAEFESIVSLVERSGPRCVCQELDGALCERWDIEGGPRVQLMANRDVVRQVFRRSIGHSVCSLIHCPGVVLLYTDQ